MKFGKQLKLQAVPEWQEYYMSYKRLKRIIKKLLVQHKEREARQMRQLEQAGTLTPEQITALKAEKEALQAQAKGTKSPIMQSYSPMLSGQSTPSGPGGIPPRPLGPGQRPLSRLGMPGDIPSNSVGVGASRHSPAQSSPLLGSGGSPGLLLGGDAYAEFFSVVETDMDKVNRFFASKYEELMESFKMLQHELKERSASQAHLAGVKRRDSEEDEELVSPKAAGGFSGSVAAVTAWMAGKRKKKREASMSKGSDGGYGSLESGGGGAAEGKEDDALLGGGGTSPPPHTISTSAQKRLEGRLQRLLDLYRTALQLQIYSMINYEGIRKIIKKFDKVRRQQTQQQQVVRVSLLCSVTFFALVLIVFVVLCSFSFFFFFFPLLPEHRRGAQRRLGSSSGRAALPRYPPPQRADRSDRGPVHEAQLSPPEPGHLEQSGNAAGGEARGGQPHRGRPHATSDERGVRAPGRGRCVRHPAPPDPAA